MATTPVRGQGTLRPLREANHERGGQTIFGVVSALHFVIRPLTKRDWRHQEKLPAEGGVIIVANHISNVDPLALGQFMAFSGRWPRFLAKVSVFEVPGLGGILRRCGQIPVLRNAKQAKDALDAAREALAQGRAVTIYPEGTITADPDLWPMKGKTGAARLALETGCPVIPIGQWGAQEIMYGKRLHLPKLLPRKTFRLEVGDPVVLDDLRDQPVTPAVLTEATARITAAITTVVAGLREQPPPAVPFDPRPRPEGERP